MSRGYSRTPVTRCSLGELAYLELGDGVLPLVEVRGPRKERRLTPLPVLSAYSLQHAHAAGWGTVEAAHELSSLLQGVGIRNATIAFVVDRLKPKAVLDEELNLVPLLHVGPPRRLELSIQDNSGGPTRRTCSGRPANVAALETASAREARERVQISNVCGARHLGGS